MLLAESTRLLSLSLLLLVYRSKTKNALACQHRRKPALTWLNQDKHGLGSIHLNCVVAFFRFLAKAPKQASRFLSTRVRSQVKFDRRRRVVVTTHTPTPSSLMPSFVSNSSVARLVRPIALHTPSLPQALPALALLRSHVIKYMRRTHCCGRLLLWGHASCAPAWAALPPRPALAGRSQVSAQLVARGAFSWPPYSEDNSTTLSQWVVVGARRTAAKQCHRTWKESHLNAALCEWPVRRNSRCRTCQR